MIRFVFLAFVLAIPPAFAAAHSKSAGTTPADGATVAEVSELSMQFDAPMRIISVTLSAADGDIPIERETGTDPVTVFRATPLQDLAPGSYRLDWRGMAADGHPMQGSFSFTKSK
ncbi:copper resistance protein CopC [Sulfitobacter albidus]|uniref:Copper resistance protein CopC n=1 Tax=Sulfitobacter albidus TaxID=2829501 RepID=A0A975JH79_9RHOB|nr:copper resistance CopC family protein [Sulfitobacter albidus]QUJ78220.1 copper resistance protein CopC [Sulfitobacter albidus]